MDQQTTLNDYEDCALETLRELTVSPQHEIRLSAAQTLLQHVQYIAHMDANKQIHGAYVAYDAGDKYEETKSAD